MNLFKNNPSIKFKQSLQKPGFTLVELLIVIFIFSAIIILTSSLLVSGYISGRTISLQKNKVNVNAQFVMSTIRQKMANASGRANVNSRDVIGIDTFENKVILIVSKNASSSTPWCTFIYFELNNAVWMADKPCDGSAPAPGTYQKLTSPDVKLTNFKLDTITAYGTPDPTEIKLSTFTLVATDPNNKSYVTLQDTYTLSHQVYQALK